MPEKLSKKVIFVDWYKTLSTTDFWFQMINVNHKYHQYHSLITNWLFVENNYLINPWMRGEYTSEDICKLIAKGINFDELIIFEELAESCKNMSLVSDKIPGLIEKIRKSGAKVVVATDNMDTFRRFTIKGLGLDNLFDDFLISFELKRLKEECSDDGRLLFFDKYIKDNNLNYQDCILLDDHFDKDGKMKSAGLESILITDTNSILQALTSYSAI